MQMCKIMNGNDRRDSGVCRRYETRAPKNTMCCVAARQSLGYGDWGIRATYRSLNLQVYNFHGLWSSSQNLLLNDSYSRLIRPSKVCKYNHLGPRWSAEFNDTAIHSLQLCTNLRGLNIWTGVPA